MENFEKESNYGIIYIIDSNAIYKTNQSFNNKYNLNIINKDIYSIFYQHNLDKYNDIQSLHNSIG